MFYVETPAAAGLATNITAALASFTASSCATWLTVRGLGRLLGGRRDEDGGGGERPGRSGEPR